MNKKNQLSQPQDVVDEMHYLCLPSPYAMKVLHSSKVEKLKHEYERLTGRSYKLYVPTDYNGGVDEYIAELEETVSKLKSNK